MEFAIGTFEGPLDLLLSLVRKEEMDIMEIDIHKITKKYLDVIQTAKHLDLSEGGEFIQMASTLMYIKSRSLLPSVESENLLEEEGPSQEDLMKALTQHQYYLQVADRLNQRLHLDRDIWLGGDMDFQPSESDDIKVDGLFSLVQAFRQAVKRVYTFPIKIALPSVLEWMLSIRSYFITGKKCSFQKLVRQQAQHQNKNQSKNRIQFVHQVLLSFLSILELGKLGIVTLNQQGEDIQIHTHKRIDDKILQVFGQDFENSVKNEKRKVT